MSRVKLGAALAILFLVVLLATAPARLLASFLPEQSLRMSGFAGTVWNGSAASASLAVGDAWLQLGQVNWTFSELFLLLLSPRLQLESSWGQQKLGGHISLSPTGKLHLRDAEARFPAALIQQWMPVQLRGNLDLLLHELRVEQGVPVAGDGRLVWQRALWRGVRGSQALGDYVLEFEVTGAGQVQAEVSTLSGPVRVDGTLKIDNRNYEVDATLSSERAFDAELAAALELMAAPVEGGYQLKFSSEF
ncbi:MAG: type II secretion system protein N [Halieaceae bacterium]